MAVSGPIILVEDDKDDQEIIHDLLREICDNPLLTFSNGEEALEFIRTSIEKPLLILSDINMPYMNGLELRRIIFNDEVLRKKSIPFIFLTTSSNKMAISEAYDLSVQGYFIKPDQINKFKNHLDLIYKYWVECQHVNV